MSKISLKKHRILVNHIKMRCFFKATSDIQRQVFLILIPPIFEEMSSSKEYIRQNSKKKLYYIRKLEEKTSQNLNMKKITDTVL